MTVSIFASNFTTFTKTTTGVFTFATLPLGILPAGVTGPWPSMFGVYAMKTTVTGQLSGFDARPFAAVPSLTFTPSSGSSEAVFTSGIGFGRLPSVASNPSFSGGAMSVSMWDPALARGGSMGMQIIIDARVPPDFVDVVQVTITGIAGWVVCHDLDAHDPIDANWLSGIGIDHFMRGTTTGPSTASTNSQDPYSAGSLWSDSFETLIAPHGFIAVTADTHESGTPPAFSIAASQGYYDLGQLGFGGQRIFIGAIDLDASVPLAVFGANTGSWMGTASTVQTAPTVRLRRRRSSVQFIG